MRRVLYTHTIDNQNLTHHNLSLSMWARQSTTTFTKRSKCEGGSRTSLARCWAAPVFLQTWSLAFINSSIFVRIYHNILPLVFWAAFSCLWANSEQVALCLLLRSGFHPTYRPDWRIAAKMSDKKIQSFPHGNVGALTEWPFASLNNAL